MGNIANLNKTLSNILKGEAVFFIGAGLSKIAGCYDWNAIISKMINHPMISAKADLQDLITTKYFSNDEIIDICKNIFINGNNERNYWEIIRDSFIIDHRKYLTDYKPIIEKFKLISPLPIIVTTNIDNCLEESRCFNLSNIFYQPRDFINSNLVADSIFHIHGLHCTLKTVNSFQDSSSS